MSHAMKILQGLVKGELRVDAEIMTTALIHERKMCNEFNIIYVKLSNIVLKRPH